MKKISEYEITVPGISILKNFCEKHDVLLSACSKAAGRLLLTAAVMIIFLLLTLDICAFVKGGDWVRYALGVDMVNYSAGFIRRGLFGEILYCMNAVFQPFVSVLLMSFISVVFMLYVLIARMIRLHANLVYIIAIVLSPSLILMHRGFEFVRSDLTIMALNLAAACILLYFIFQKKCSTGKFRGMAPEAGRRQSFAGMLFIDALIFAILTVSALIHELSITLLPPVMLLFLLYARRVHRTAHCLAVAALLLAIYAVMMAFFKFQDVRVIADSWSGVFGSSDGRDIPSGLEVVASRERAMAHVRVSSESLTDFSVMDMVIAVAEPFIILLFSGISIFSSSSFRFRAIRWMILISCLSPLCLSFVAYDYGRWFAFSAMQLTLYSLLLAHRAGRRRSVNNRPENRRNLISLVKMCLTIAIMLHFIDLRLYCPGAFWTSKTAFAEEIAQSVTGLPDFGKCAGQLLTRELIITPYDEAD